MDVTELLPSGMLLFDVLVIAAALYGIVYWWRRNKAIFPAAASKYGLTFAHESRRWEATGMTYVDRLRGTVNGAPLEVESTYKTQGRLRARRTVIASRAPVRLPACTINVSRRRPVATVHLVPTGDAHFDAQRALTCDRPTVVRDLLTPAVRAALLACPQPELQLVLDGERVDLVFPNTPFSQAELQGPIDVVLAIAQAGTPTASDQAAMPHPVGAGSRSEGRMHAQLYLEQLGRAHGFTLAELQTNRLGLVHPGQLASGTRLGLGAALTTFVLGTLALAGGLLGAYLFHESLGPKPTQTDLNAVYAIGGVGVVVALAFFIGTGVSLAKRQARNAAYAKRRIDVLEGALHKVYVQGRTDVPDRYLFKVDGRSFDASRTLFELLTEGAHYKLYCVGDRLLSFEPVTR